MDISDTPLQRDIALDIAKQGGSQLLQATDVGCENMFGVNGSGVIKVVGQCPHTILPFDGFTLHPRLGVFIERETDWRSTMRPSNVRQLAIEAFCFFCILKKPSISNSMIHNRDVL